MLQRADVTLFYLMQYHDKDILNEAKNVSNLIKLNNLSWATDA